MRGQKKFKYYSKEAALLKAQKYCAYQERSHSEVRNKLFEWNQKPNEAEEIISALIERDFLNEERFARLFAGGKFRMKQWGRNKITYELKAKGVSDYCIERGLSEIDGRDYLNTLKKLVAKKKKQVKGENGFQKNAAIAKYLVGKGYEPDLVWEELKSRQ